MVAVMLHGGCQAQLNAASSVPKTYLGDFGIQNYGHGWYSKAKHIAGCQHSSEIHASA